MEPSTRIKPSWLTGPCVRQSDLLLILHQQLQRKHSYYLLPPFPRANQRDPGWGTDAYLQRNRRRLQRYFDRILTRPDLRAEVAMHDFMTAKEEIPDNQRGLLYVLRRWLIGNGWKDEEGDVFDEHINIYRPSHLNLNEEINEQEIMARSLKSQKHALKAIHTATNGAIQALQQYEESLGRISKCMHEVTAVHTIYSQDEIEMQTDETSGKLPKEYNQLYSNERLQAIERRFRELGDRFIDLVNQLQPGLGEIATTVENTVMEVLEDQQHEIGHVYHYINREISSLRKFDQTAGRRHQVEGRISRADAPEEVIARQQAAIHQARTEELCQRIDYEERADHLKIEMKEYWRQTDAELAASISETIKNTLDVGRVHVDALKAWFPPEHPAEEDEGVERHSSNDSKEKSPRNWNLLASNNDDDSLLYNS